MRLVDTSNGCLICILCGRTSKNMSHHVRNQHNRETNQIYQLCKQYDAAIVYRRWLVELKQLPFPPPIIITIDTDDQQRTSTFSSQTSLSQKSPIMLNDDNVNINHKATVNLSQTATSAGIIRSSSYAKSRNDENISSNSQSTASCVMCQCCKKYVNDAQRHIFVAHISTTMFKCPHCLFSSNFDRKKVHEHMKSVHYQTAEEKDVVSLLHESKIMIENWYALCFPELPIESFQEEAMEHSSPMVANDKVVVDGEQSTIKPNINENHKMFTNAILPTIDRKSSIHIVTSANDRDMMTKKMERKRRMKLILDQEQQQPSCTIVDNHCDIELKQSKVAKKASSLYDTVVTRSMLRQTNIATATAVRQSCLTLVD